MGEKLANLGYFALKEQAAENTPVIPNVFIPIYEESMLTAMNVDEDNPIVGNRAARFQTLPGMRSHSGTLNLLSEPNTSAYIWSMLLKRGTVTGAGPYTWPFTLDAIVQPFTIEFLKGDVVFRFWDVKARAITPTFNENKMQYNVDVSARGSFVVREVASVAGVGPSTVTLKTNYDPVPTKGLVAGDLVSFHDISGDTLINTTITTVDNDTDITCPVDLSSIVAGDLVHLRGQTPSLTVQPPFGRARTEFRFGATAAAALSATQTQLEPGSQWNLIHSMKEDEGEKRSGSFDPAALVHVQGDAELSVSRFFERAEDLNRFLTVGKRACVVRHFSEPISATNQELRITLNDLRLRESNPPLKTGEVLFNEMNFAANYDSGDAQMFSVTVINNLAAL